VDEARVGKAVVAVDEFQPPERLGDAAAAVWREIVPELVEIGLVRSIDATALEALCDAVAMARTARAMIDAEGFVARGDRGSVVHPAYRVWRDSWTLALKIAGEYGLTAVARIRVGAAVLHQRSLAEELLDALDSPEPDVINVAAARRRRTSPRKRS
jgi:P27 family predicted phage terminase small subunit